MIIFLWGALAVTMTLLIATIIGVSLLRDDVTELEKRIRTMDDGVWFSNKLSNLEWRISELEPVKQRETITLDEYRQMRSKS